jgi:hypothetical protein
MEMPFPALAPKIGRFDFERRSRTFMIGIDSWDVGPPSLLPGFERPRVASPSLETHASFRLSSNGPTTILPVASEEPAPNGGIRAWTQVFTASLLVMNGFGYINSFGVFQEIYAMRLGRDPASISFVGSFQIFLLFFVGTLSGRALDAGYFRSLLAAGCSLQVLGIYFKDLPSVLSHCC